MLSIDLVHRNVRMSEWVLRPGGTDEGNKELQAAMTQTREEEGKSGFKHRHEWYQGTKNY